MWHRFDAELRSALNRAVALAEHDGVPSLGTGHILASLTENDSVTSRILSIVGEASHSTTFAAYPTIETCGDERYMGLTVEARATIDNAYRLAAELGDNSIGCEHVLLSIVKQPDRTDGGRSLAAMGVGWDDCGRELMRLQRKRTIAPSGISVPGLRLRKLTVRARHSVWQVKRMAFVAAGIKAPYKQYALKRRLTIERPYAFYRELRRQPFYWDAMANCWIVTGYKEVAAALAEPRISQRIFAPDAWAHNDLPPTVQREFRYLQDSLDRQMLFLDAPQHPRQRSLVAKRFTPRVIGEMREMIEKVAREMIDTVAPKDRTDVISDLAISYPLCIITRMLDLPISDFAMLKKWSSDYFTYLNFESNLAQDVAAYQSVREATAYFAALIPQRRDGGGQDLISLLLQADEHGERLPDDEIISNCLLLLATGHENTTRLIGTGLLALFRHPDQNTLLRGDLSLMASAVEEMLRFDSPVQWTLRHVLQDVELSGCALKAGQKVQIGIAAANRDPGQFADPDRFDIQRTENRHLAFGHGAHFCLGAALTRLEVQILFAAMLDRFPRLRLAGTPAFLTDGLTFRGLKSLPVRWN